MKVSFAGCYHVVKDAVAGAKTCRPRLPFSKSFTTHPQRLAKIRTNRPRLAAFHLRNNSGIQLEAPEGRQLHLPPRSGAFHSLRFRGEVDNSLSRNMVLPAVVKNDGIIPDNRLKVSPQNLARHAAYLENIHVVSLVSQLHNQLKFLKVEIFKREVVKQRAASQQLLAPDMHRVLRDLIVIACCALAGGELNLRCERLLRARRQDDSTVTINAKLQPAEKSGIVMEEANVR